MRRINRLMLWVLHISFVFMITGGVLTWLTSYRGELHLAPGVEVSDFVDTDSVGHTLPASLTLLSFTQQLYPGMSMPSDFVSEIAVEGGHNMIISMNKIGRIGGYRLYQTSFDNQGGTVLTVSYDPYGTSVVYLGFLLFAISGGWIVCYRLFGRMRLHNGRKVITRIGAIIVFLSVCGECHAVSAVPQSAADSLSYEPVLYNGRVVPFATPAVKLTYKLTGRGDVGGLSPEAFVASVIKYKEEWAYIPFIKIRSERLRSALGVKGDYVSVGELYDDRGEYRPEKFYQGGRGPIDADILKLDERVSLLMELWQGELIQSPDSDLVSRRSPLSLYLEALYYHSHPVFWLFLISIFVAISALISIFIPCRRVVTVSTILLSLLGVIMLVWQWAVIGRAAMVSTNDLMAFVAVIMLIVTACVALRNYSGTLVAIFMLCSAFMLLVSWIGMKDPVMTPLMPVLATPWLSVHVSLMMVSFTLLGLTMPLSVMALAIRREQGRLISLSYSLLMPGVYLLGLGIIIGAMWANVSWGRYWAWDPKETCALLTMLLYAIPLHRISGLYHRPRLLAVYLILAFLSIVMTYSGVNHLSSLHAYRS